MINNYLRVCMHRYLVQLFVSNENFEKFVVYEGKVLENAHNHWPELLDLDNCERKHKSDLLIIGQVLLNICTKIRGKKLRTGEGLIKQLFELPLFFLGRGGG